MLSLMIWLVISALWMLASWPHSVVTTQSINGGELEIVSRHGETEPRTPGHAEVQVMRLEILFLENADRSCWCRRRVVVNTVESVAECSRIREFCNNTALEFSRLADTSLRRRCIFA